MRVLLVEPDYYTRYPPLGLLKFATFHKDRGDQVQLVRGAAAVDFVPDQVLVTSLFTWDWRPVWKSVRYYKALFPNAQVILGGIYASLLPDHAKMSGADQVWRGTHPQVDTLTPDYSLVPSWPSSILFATRGCPRKCGFCSVPKLEGPPTASVESVESQIHEGHRKVVFFDNNILGLPSAVPILKELADLGVEADFNQGMDVRYLTPKLAEVLAKVRMPVIRLAFDYSGIRPWVQRGIALLKEQGIRGRKLVFYTLHNYVDDPEDFFQRVRDLLSWGVVVYPMRYEPLCTLEKGQYIAPKWNQEALSMVARARRVIGYGGAFPPYAGLVQKFKKAKSFKEAFSLRPEGDLGDLPEPLIEMAMEHEQQDAISRQYWSAARRVKDWRKVLVTTSSPGR